MTAAALSDDERPWLLRPYDARLDEDGLLHFLGTGYFWSNAGRRAGVDRKPLTAEDELRRREFLSLYEPMWRWLLVNAEVTVAVDPEHPDTSIWGWLVTSGETVVHAIGCKTDIVDVGLARDIVLDLLGPRWRTFQLTTLELPQLRSQPENKPKIRNIFGFDRPSKWALDPSWLAVRRAA